MKPTLLLFILIFCLKKNINEKNEINIKKINKKFLSGLKKEKKRIQLRRII